MQLAAGESVQLARLGISNSSTLELRLHPGWYHQRCVHGDSMEPNGEDNTQGVHSRRYMSKSQRACDFCRERKSACRIQGGAPCQLCSYYKRECTFNTASGARKRRRLINTDAVATVATSTRPSSAACVSGPSAANLTETPTTHTPDAQISEHMCHPAVSTDLNGIFLPEDFHSDVQSDVPLMDDAFGSFNDWFPSPNQFMDVVEGTDVPEQSSIQEGRYCGLSGDMDPYLLRLYRFNQQSHFPFKKLTVRSVDAGRLPVQFLQTLRDGPDTENPVADNDEISRAELSAIVPHAIGVRLVSL